MPYLDKKQRGVAFGMAVGLLVSVVALLFGSRLFAHLGLSERLSVGLLLPATALFVAIARVAKHRFFTPADIDGSALSAGTERAKVLQSLLQNTTEQLALVVPVYVAALFSQHENIQAVAPVCACLFLLGRLLFFATYHHGASARSLGFALTFYPTVLLLIWQLSLLPSAIAG